MPEYYRAVRHWLLSGLRKGEKLCWRPYLRLRVKKENQEPILSLPTARAGPCSQNKKQRPTIGRGAEDKERALFVSDVHGLVTLRAEQ